MAYPPPVPDTIGGGVGVLAQDYSVLANKKEERSSIIHSLAWLSSLSFVVQQTNERTKRCFEVVVTKSHQRRRPAQRPLTVTHCHSLPVKWFNTGFQNTLYSYQYLVLDFRHCCVKCCAATSINSELLCTRIFQVLLKSRLLKLLFYREFSVHVNVSVLRN